MKKSKELLICAVIVIIGLIVTLVIMGNMQDDDANRSTDPDLLPFIGVSEMHDVLDDTSGAGVFVYVGRASCPLCQRFEPVFEALLAEIGQSMSYFEIDRLDAAGESDGIIEIMTRLERVANVPTLVYIQNGVVAGILDGEEIVAALTDDEGVMHEVLMEFFDEYGGLN